MLSSEGDVAGDRLLWQSEEGFSRIAFEIVLGDGEYFLLTITCRDGAAGHPGDGIVPAALGSGNAGLQQDQRLRIGSLRQGEQRAVNPLRINVLFVPPQRL